MTRQHHSSSKHGFSVQDNRTFKQDVEHVWGSWVGMDDTNSLFNTHVKPYLFESLLKTYCSVLRDSLYVLFISGGGLCLSLLHL